MTWLTVTEYRCHKWQRICLVGRNHNTVLSSLITYHLLSVLHWLRFLTTALVYSNVSFSYISWREQVVFLWDDDDVRNVLYPTCFICFLQVIKQSADRRVRHIMFFMSEEVLLLIALLINAACIAEKQQILII